MDPDVELVWDILKHIFPEFTLQHVQVYMYLWRIDARSGEQIALDTCLSKSTVYRILHELVHAGLLCKTHFKPIAYYAQEPLKAYNMHLKKIFSKLENGREKMDKIIKNASSLGGELYFVKRDGGQLKLVVKQNHKPLEDPESLRQLRKAIDQQLEKAEGNTKQFAIYR